MPATNFTPIQLYRSTTASQVPTSGNLSDGELAINTNDEKLYFKNSGGTVKLLASSAGASGDVVGPASATDNAVVRFDGTTGKLVQNSVVTIADSTGDVAGVGALSMGGNLTLSGGTANGVLYLNGSKVATSGSALTFDGNRLTVSSATPSIRLDDTNATGPFGIDWYFSGAGGVTRANITLDGNTAEMQFQAGASGSPGWFQTFVLSGSEAMRLTSTGLGIGTSSPLTKLQITSGAVRVTAESTTNSSNAGYRWSVKDSGGNVGNSGIYVEPTASISGRYFGFAVDDSTYAMVLNNSGNLGLGVTPSAWGTNFRAQNFGSTGVLYARNGGVELSGIGSNAYSNNTDFLYIQSSPASLYQQTAGVHQFFTAPSGTAGNAITFTQALTLNTNGALVLQGGDTAASGVGVAFPATQSASSNANTLDDYEEGSFTPTIATGSANVTYTQQAGNYTKVGRLVTFGLTITLNTVTSAGSGDFEIGGLPFASSSSDVNQTRLVCQTSNVNFDATAYQFYAYTPTTSSSVFRVLYSYDNGSWSVAQANNFVIAAGSIIVITGFYYTDT